MVRQYIALLWGWRFKGLVCHDGETVHCIAVVVEV